MPTIAFATCTAFASLTADDRLAVTELEKRGLQVEPLIWDDPQARAVASFDAVVLRSCWDYHEKPALFAAFLERLAAARAPLFNSARVAAWNANKQYLLELRDRGARVPATAWVEAGSATTLAQVLDANGLDDAVVKPAVSMLGLDTWRTSRATAARTEQDFAELLGRGRSLLVQEFLPGVLSLGEVSLVFLGGQFSHAVRKVPREGEFRIHEEHGGSRHAIDPSPRWIQQAEAIVDLVGEPLLYARLDGIPVGEDLVLMELELIDPALFLAYHPEAAGRFADAVISARSRAAPPVRPE